MTQSRRATGTRSELVLSASSISRFLSCPAAFHFQYRQNLQKRGWHPALERGTAVHEALQAHWTGGSVPKALAEWYERSHDIMMPHEFELFQQDFERVSQLIARYVEARPVPDDLVIVAKELELSAQVAPGVRVVGYADLAGTWDNKFRLVELKTSASLVKRMSYLDIDPQPVLYYLMAQESGMPVHEVVWEGLNTYAYKKLADQPDEKLFIRKLIRPTDEQVERAKKNAADVAELIRQADESERFVKRLGAGCLQCDFREVCHSEERGDERLAQAYRNTVYTIRKREE